MDDLKPSIANDWFIRLEPITSTASPISFNLAQLLITNEPKSSKMLIAGGGLVGRKSSSTPPKLGQGEVDSPIVSRAHVQLLITPNGHVYVIDLGSMHGTSIIPSGKLHSPSSPIPCFQRQPIQLLEGDILVFGKRVVSGEIPYDPIEYEVRFRHPKLGAGSRSEGERKELGKLSTEKAFGKFASLKDEARLTRVLQDASESINRVSVVKNEGRDSDNDEPGLVTPPSPKQAIDHAGHNATVGTADSTAHHKHDQTEPMSGSKKTNTYGVPQSFIYDSEEDDIDSQVASEYHERDAEVQEEAFTDHEDEDDNGSPETMGIGESDMLNRPLPAAPSQGPHQSGSYQSISAEGAAMIDLSAREIPTLTPPIARVSALKSQSLLPCPALFPGQSPPPELFSPRSPRPLDLKPFSSGIGSWFTYSSDAEDDDDHHEDGDSSDITRPHQLHLRGAEISQTSENASLPSAQVEAYSVSSFSSCSARTGDKEGCPDPQQHQTDQTASQELDLQRDPLRLQQNLDAREQADDMIEPARPALDQYHASSVSSRFGQLPEQSPIGKLATKVYIEAVQEQKFGSDEQDYEGSSDYSNSVSSSSSFSQSVYDDDRSASGDYTEVPSDPPLSECGSSQYSGYQDASSAGHYNSDEYEDQRSDDRVSAVYSDYDDDGEIDNIHHADDDGNSEASVSDDDAANSSEEEDGFGERHQLEEDGEDMDPDKEMAEEEDSADDDDDMSEENDMEEDEDDEHEESDLSENSDVDEDAEADKGEQNSCASPLAEPNTAEDIPKLKIEKPASTSQVAAAQTLDSGEQEREQEQGLGNSSVDQGELTQSSIRDYCETKVESAQIGTPSSGDKEVNLPDQVVIKQEKVGTDVPEPEDDRQDASDASEYSAEQDSGKDSSSTGMQEVQLGPSDSHPQPAESLCVVANSHDVADKRLDGSEAIDRSTASFDRDQSGSTDTQSSKALDGIIGTDDIVDASIPNTKVRPRTPSVRCDSSEPESDGPVTPPSSRKRPLPDDFAVIDQEGKVELLAAYPSSSPTSLTSTIPDMGRPERPLKRAKRIGSAFGLLAIGAALGSASTIVGLMQLGERQS
ncbi:hypothetical protein I317_06591 [Kwoniella heveanensis CBS 569]|nr:hypothetical protein I317_06591 [Kwoniella heveanensis CBS 569]